MTIKCHAGNSSCWLHQQDSLWLFLLLSFSILLIDRRNFTSGAMSVFTAEIHPGKSVGLLLLGTSLHDILSRLKNEPEIFTRLDLVFSPTQPATEPIILHLPTNGLRLRFDGPGQRLRLIEVLDFSKSRLSYDGKDVVKAGSTRGPAFNHVYNQLVGVTEAGEFIPPNNNSEYGNYVLSWPGMAYTFPVVKNAWTAGKDYEEVMSSSAALGATSMAVYYGRYWPDVRSSLFITDLPNPKSLLTSAKNKEPYPDEINIVRIKGSGELEMQRSWAATPFRLELGRTTPQDLVAELGAPDAIFYKNDKRMMIHKVRNGRPHGARPAVYDDYGTDTDQSSNQASTDMSGDDSDPERGTSEVIGECFYNYFYHGFDVLISAPTEPSRRPPSKIHDEKASPFVTSAPLVATKIILHSNVPGSYSFNRHRRCQWKIDYVSSSTPEINSEALFSDIEKALHDEWKSIYANPEEAKLKQRGMVLNRGYVPSPSSSCELLDNWEDGTGGQVMDGVNPIQSAAKGLGNTTLYGFPGLVFEILKNGCVSALTVF